MLRQGNVIGPVEIVKHPCTVREQRVKQYTERARDPLLVMWAGSSYNISISDRWEVLC